jgi:hypothetical protein
MKNQGRKCPSVKEVKGRQWECGSKLNLNIVKAEDGTPTLLHLLRTDLIQNRLVTIYSAALNLCLAEPSILLCLF